MATLVQGVVSRIFVQVGDRNSVVNITLKLVGSKEIYEGQSMERGDEFRKILLTKPGDDVDFKFEKDFRNYFRAFFNHTLEAELAQDDD
jgi:hypothetical protein